MMPLGGQMPQRVGQHGLLLHSGRGRVHTALDTGFVDASATSVFAVVGEATRVLDGAPDKFV